MTSTPNPYVGPRSFRAGEALYGRDREVQELIDLLIAERIVLLHSPSGAGKSSLIQAALAPAMRKEGFAVRAAMRVGMEIPAEVGGANRYAVSCMQSLEEERPAGNLRPISTFAGQTLEDYLGAPGESELLIFDQFEEVLTVDPMNRAAKEAFFTQLGAVLRQRSRWALFAMREDYVAALDQYVRPVPTRLSTRYGLKLLEVKPALLAMREPAARARVEFDAAAAGKLADDLRRVQVQLPDGSMEEQLGPYIEPVQLQVVCYRLWEHLADSATSIGEADIGGTGDVNSALEGYYADSVAAIVSESGVSERAVRDWCERSLITAQGIRGQVMQGRDPTEGLANQAVWMLVDRHLVRTDKRHGVTWFELAHDRLIEPVRQSNAKWREANLSPMQKRAALWEEQRRPAGLLMLGAELSEAQRWAAGCGTGLPACPPVGEERAEAQRSAASLTDVERAYLAESETAQCGVEREKRDARRIRMLAVVSCVVALVAVGALVKANLVEKDLVTAVTQEHSDLTRADKAEQKEQVEATAANEEATIATAGHLAALSLTMRSSQLNTARLLSAAAYRVMDMPETRSALAATTFYQMRRIDSLTVASNIKHMNITADGKLLAFSGANNTVNFYIVDRRGFHDAGFLYTGTPSCIAFSADGKHLASGWKGDVTLYDRTSGVWQPERKLSTGNAIFDMAFSPAVPGAQHSGNLLAVANGVLTVFDWQTGKSVLQVDDVRGVQAVKHVAFSPDGKHLAATLDPPAAGAFDVGVDDATGKATFTVTALPNTGVGGFLSFSPHSDRLASTTMVGPLREMNLTGKAATTSSPVNALLSATYRRAAQPAPAAAARFCWPLA